MLAQDMLDTTGWAGLPSGYAAVALGSLGVVAAAIPNNIPLLFICLFIYGAGTATNLQATLRRRRPGQP